MAEGEHYSYFSIVLNNWPIVLNPKSHPGILIEVILIKQKACSFFMRINFRESAKRFFSRPFNFPNRPFPKLTFFKLFIMRNLKRQFSLFLYNEQSLKISSGLVSRSKDISLSFSVFFYLAFTASDYFTILHFFPYPTSFFNPVL